MKLRRIATPSYWEVRATRTIVWKFSSCRFAPTCSEYAVEAVRTHGIVVGIVLAIGRVLRCNPLFHGGYHPVPARRHTCAHHRQEL